MINKNSIFTHKSIYNMNMVGSKIRRFREDRGIKQEHMAHELELTQSSYGRLEKDDNRLTVPKIQKIAEVLNVPVSILFGEKTGNILYENNGNNVQTSTLVQNYETEHIKSLKEEITFLRKLLEGKMK
ncbi:MAG: helix-turn-helix domain-containing protein [Flavobacteriaceae bacterium]|jgi:transcriptional regulator with XRE-family HTH domain|nr:helix-turn-helix domain-containing protein [Flavobacteriaceae bacterium]